MYFYGSNLGPPGTGPSWTLDLHLNNLVKYHLAMLHMKFQASEQSSSEEEDFLISLYAFLWCKPRGSEEEDF